MKKTSAARQNKKIADVPDNMKVFHLVALRILNQLYEAFPLPVEIIPRSISSEILSADAPPDDVLNSVVIADNTLRWLETEGFLRHSSSGFEAGIFYQVQLTLKGLAVLNSVPPGNNEEPESLIRKIRKALCADIKTAHKDALRGVLDELFNMAFIPAKTNIR